MSRSPTNGQNLKTSAPPVVKTFRSRLSTTDKNLEDTVPVVLDIITENEDEADKNENDTGKTTDMLNNNAKKFSEDTNMQTDETTEDSAGKSDPPVVSAVDEIIKSAGLESEVQFKAKNVETVILNTSVTSPTVEETNITPNDIDIVDKSVTDTLEANNDQNELNEEKISMTSSSAENMKDPESSDKIDDSMKEPVNIEEDINISNKELTDANNCEFPIEKDSTLNKISLVLEKEDNSDLQVDTQIIDDSDPKQKDVKTNEAESENKLDSTEETIDKLEITQEEKMMEKLEINEDAKDCKENISVSEKSLIDSMSANTNENEDNCNDSAKNESSEDEKIVAKPTEISIATEENMTEGEKEATRIVMEIEVTQNEKVSEGNKDPGNENSKQIEVTNVILPEQNNSSNSIQELDVVEVSADEEQTNTKEQSVVLDNSVTEPRINTEVSPRKILEITNTSDSEPIIKDDSISNNVSGEIKDRESDSATNEDDVTNISIVSTDKTHTTVDKCENEENCEINISIVDSTHSNVSSTPIKDTSIDKSESAGKDHDGNVNLSLVNDDGKSYSPIINRIENISVDFEYSNSSIVDSSGTALQETDVLTENETKAAEDDVEQVAKDSHQELCETSFQNQKESEDSNKSNNEIPKEAKIFNEKELNNSITQNDDSSNGNINEDEMLNRSKNDNSSKENISKDAILNKPNKKDTSSNEDIESSEEIGTKPESPKKENNETKAKESVTESTEQSRDKILDDFIQCFKADKKRKRQTSDDSVAESPLKQRKRRKHKTELHFSSESDENSDIVEAENGNKLSMSEESEDVESDDYEANEFIDDMASEGSEETPSIDSNEIIDEGESLLSGSEDIECWTPKRKRVITIASDSDDDLEKMSMEPFGGSSPSLISINQISSVDSDLESIKCKNEELSKFIEEKTKSDTDDTDVIIVNESINKPESHVVLQNKSTVEELSENTLENIDKIQQPGEKLKDTISNTGDPVNDLERMESSPPEPINDTEDEKERPVENPDISEELIVEQKPVDEQEMIEEVFETEPEIYNEVEDNIEKESDNSANTQEMHNKEKDAKYKAILDKYFKQFDEKISKITRRRTTGMFSNENNDDTMKRKRRQSLDTGEKKSQNDTSTDMFEVLYKESKKAKIPINNDDNEENVFDTKQEEAEPKKTNTKVKKRTTDENSQQRISDAVEQKKTLESAKRHSLTNIENIPGKYVQSPGRLNKSFSGYSSSREIEIIQKYIAIDNTESTASMLKDFSDTVKDDIKAAKAYVASPKKKKSYDASELNESGTFVEPLSEPNKTSDFVKTISSPKIPLLAISPVKKDYATLKRKKKHSKSVDTLMQEELPTSGIIDTEVYTKIKKQKKQIKLETNTIQCNEQADKDNLEINLKKKKQLKNTDEIKKSKRCMKLPTPVSVINAEETDKQKYKHSNLAKNSTEASVDYLNDVSENTGVKLIDQKNMNNKKWKQLTASKSYTKNKNRSLPDNKFVVKKEHAIASKSEYDVINEYVARNINIYKNLIRPSGRGTTGGNITVENLHAASIKIKKEKKKQKYNRSGKVDGPVAKASFTGQTNCCNFKEELLFGNNVKRVAVSDILKKKRSLK
ncbi:hypothetical protein CBL_04403 [Carabus blaptoides fortunei]